MLFGSHKARPEDNIRPAFQDGSDQSWIFLRIVFQVGILNDQDGSGGLRDATAQSGAFSAIHIVSQGLHARMARRAVFQNGGRTIVRADLTAHKLSDGRLLKHQLDDLTQSVLLVIDRHDHRETRSVRIER